MNQARGTDFSNTYEMNYMNPPASNPSAGIPVHNAHQNYGFQYAYTPPDGNPPKYEDVMSGNFGHQSAYLPTVPVTLNSSNPNQFEEYNYFPPSPYPTQDTFVNIEPESRAQPQPQAQQSLPRENTPNIKKTKNKSNCCLYLIIRIIIAIIIAGVIRGIVYATYR